MEGSKKMLKLQSYGNKGKMNLVWGEPGNKFFQEIIHMVKLSQEKETERERRQIKF